MFLSYIELIWVRYNGDLLLGQEKKNPKTKTLSTRVHTFYLTHIYMYTYTHTHIYVHTYTYIDIYVYKTLVANF